VKHHLDFVSTVANDEIDGFVGEEVVLDGGSVFRLSIQAAMSSKHKGSIIEAFKRRTRSDKMSTEELKRSLEAEEIALREEKAKAMAMKEKGVVVCNSSSGGSGIGDVAKVPGAEKSEKNNHSSSGNMEVGAEGTTSSDVEGRGMNVNGETVTINQRRKSRKSHIVKRVSVNAEGMEVIEEIEEEIEEHNIDVDRKKAYEEETQRICVEISKIRVPLLLTRDMTINDLKHKFICREFLVKITVPSNMGLPKITIWRPMLYYGRTGNWFYQTTKLGVSTKVLFEVFYADGMHQLLSAETIRRSIVTTSAVPIDEFNNCRFHFWNQFLFGRIAKQMLRKK
jgi:hypothetical protein